MIGKLIIGAAVVGVGYLAYKAYKSSKGLPGAVTVTDQMPATPLQQEQAAGLAQKFLPGGYGHLEGGCMGCMGGAVVQIL